jgi:hypothetical protein
MRPFVALLALLALPLATSAFAQSAARALPPGSVPLEEPPPPPDVADDNAALSPQVTLRKEDDRTIAEYRHNGKLYMMKVTPRHGRAYVLMDTHGDGQFARTDGLDNGLRVPQWVLLEF